MCVCARVCVHGRVCVSGDRGHGFQWNFSKPKRFRTTSPMWCLGIDPRSLEGTRFLLRAPAPEQHPQQVEQGDGLGQVQHPRTELLSFHLKGVFKAIEVPGPLPGRWGSPFSGLLDVPDGAGLGVGATGPLPCPLIPQLPCGQWRPRAESWWCLVRDYGRQWAPAESACS